MTLLTDDSASPRILPRRTSPHRAPRLPATAVLLASGGDGRITVDPATGYNRYLCPPQPEPHVAAFGSSTASTVSDIAFAAAAGLRQRLEHDLAGAAPAPLYAEALDRMRGELAFLCGIEDLAGLAIAFAASGTDLHLLAAQLAAGKRAKPLAVMVDPTETGSGVPAALAGRHFAPATAQGAAVTPGETVGSRAIETAAITIRDLEGMPRPAAAIDAEVEALVAKAASAGRRILLTLVDVSKTGIVAPSPGLALTLQRQFPESVVLLVDACQFRLSTPSLRAYLERGFMVALTGSKFLTGPAFSGALLIPGETAARLRRRTLTPGLAAYASRAELPAGWAARRELGGGANFGLLLRWEAALAELRLFRRVPDASTAVFLTRFAAAVAGRLATDPAFLALPVPPIDRLPAPMIEEWDRIPTIFPFLLRDPRRPTSLLTRTETARVYGKLAALTPRHQVGQPVSCGVRDGESLAALRLCASARLVVAAALCGADTVIEQALATLDAVKQVAAA
jgi:hypothetical protein